MMKVRNAKPSALSAAVVLAKRGVTFLSAGGQTEPPGGRSRDALPGICLYFLKVSSHDANPEFFGHIHAEHSVDFPPLLNTSCLTFN